MNRFILPATLTFLGFASAISAAEPKRLLVVSANVGARHASIPNGEKMLRELDARSNGQFALTMMSDAADYPFFRVPGAGRGAVPGFPGQVPTASAAALDALFVAGTAIAPLVNEVNAARTELATIPFTQPSSIQAKAGALAVAELNLALARASALAHVQTPANRLSPEQVQALAGSAAGRGGRGGAALDTGPAVTKLFQDYLSPASLAKYDGIILLNTTGALPFPDRDAFLKWVADGHAVVAIHGAMDTSYYTPDSMMEMLAGGARYATAVGGTTTPYKVFKVDGAHPASRDWPDGLTVVDEFYQFHRANPEDKNTNLPGIDRTKVHSLLDVEIDGKRLPVAWTRMQGKGRVFYTSLGHRDDVMLAGTPASDGNAKLNSDEVSAAYRNHLLNGILWSLGLVEGSSATGNTK